MPSTVGPSELGAVIYVRWIEIDCIWRGYLRGDRAIPEVKFCGINPIAANTPPSTAQMARQGSEFSLMHKTHTECSCKYGTDVNNTQGCGLRRCAA